MADNIDAKLFPAPNHRQGSVKNPLLPRTWPGVTPASTTALQTILTDNHKRWHVFYPNHIFHNHSAHAALSLWCLGADKSILQTSYEAGCNELRPAFASPNPITRQNWKDYLGDENYYQSYLEFFKGELEQKDFGGLLEEYLFASDANFVSGAKQQPEMLSRFLAGLLHPMIHTGLGAEFSMPGIFVEGLAQTAVHPTDSTNILPPAIFNQSVNEGSLASHFASAVSVGGRVDKKDIHAFTILARILADRTFSPKAPEDQFLMYSNAIAIHGESIRKYVDQWSLDGDLQKKLEELTWTNALIYAVGGSEETGQFNADFFHMHLVTSSIFLSSIFSHLKRSSQIVLLRGYFSVCLTWYIARGRPSLDISRFFTNPATLLPVSPGPHPTPHKAARPSPSSPHTITPNPWLPIIQLALAHPDDHLPKLQRALSEYASHFGNTLAGSFAGTELKDAELIDGTLFIRAAGLTATRLGWVREGEAPLEGGWDVNGFYNVPQL